MEAHTYTGVTKQSRRTKHNSYHLVGLTVPTNNNFGFAHEEFTTGGAASAVTVLANIQSRRNVP